MDTHILEELRSQVGECLASPDNSPFVFYRLMKLQEALDQVIGDLASPETVSSQPTARHFGVRPDIRVVHTDRDTEGDE